METRRTALTETILTAIVAMLILIIVWGMVSPHIPLVIVAVAVAALGVLGYMTLRYTVDPDHLRARQSVRTLYLARKTSTFMSKGLSHESAKAVCDLLLPHTAAVAIAITDREKILGYAGVDDENVNIDDTVQTHAYAKTLQDGIMRVLVTPEAVGMPANGSSIKAAIVVPLVVSDEIKGSLRLFFHSSRMIDETQQAMAEGLGQLLSTQLSVAELEAQKELATNMELKALQAQINPHFLFNTINTIASLIRTDPDRARVLLKEFAVFYRRTLENSEDLIPFRDELLQTERYFGFVEARFGEERVGLESSVEPGLEDVLVPSFIIQPIVENAVNHGMRAEGKLHVTVKAVREGDDMIVTVEDDGVGIKPEVLPKTLQAGYGTGMGIALTNVNDRLKGFFGATSGIKIESEYGVGTTVYLTLHDAR